MKVVRIGFLAVLAVLAAQFSLAQSNTTSGQGQQTSSSTQQQPTSPLQDQPTGIAAEQQAQQQSQKSGQLSQFEAPTPAAQDQSLGEIRMMTRYTQINGDQTRSFLDPGSNNLAEFNYFMDRRFLVTHRMQTLSMFRSTDDYSIDPEKVSIQKGYVRIYGPKDEYIFGDALVNYSRLTFNQNVKGVSTSWLLGDHWKLSMVGGIFIDRWGSLYKDLPTRPYMSRVAGGRLAWSPTRDFVLGWNFSASDDILSSLAYAPLGSVPQPASNRIGSMDFKFQQKNLRVTGEYGYSITDFDSRGSGVPCSTTDPNGNLITIPCDTRTPQPNVGYQGDWGAQVEASYRLHRFNLRGSYVRFQPNFASINARQIADLEDILVRPGYDFTDWLTIDGTMRYSGNDLKDQLPYKTTLWGPEARVLLHDMSFYRRAVLEMGYRDRIVSSSNFMTAPTSTMGTVDSYVRGPYAELTIPVSTTFMTVGYERRNLVDHIVASNSSNTNRFYAGLRGVYDFGGWHINPSFRWELERQGLRPFSDYMPPIFDLQYDSNRLDTVSLVIEPPKWFIIEGGFRAATATTTAATTDVPAVFYPNGYSRPSYRAQLTYKIQNDENKLVIFTFERNSNFYYTSPDFDERIMGVTLVWKFGKRGR